MRRRRRGRGGVYWATADAILSVAEAGAVVDQSCSSRPLHTDWQLNRLSQAYTWLSALLTTCSILTANEFQILFVAEENIPLAVGEIIFPKPARRKRFENELPCFSSSSSTFLFARFRRCGSEGFLFFCHVTGCFYWNYSATTTRNRVGWSLDLILTKEDPWQNLYSFFVRTNKNVLRLSEKIRAKGGERESWIWFLCFCHLFNPALSSFLAADLLILSSSLC